MILLFIDSLNSRGKEILLNIIRHRLTNYDELQYIASNSGRIENNWLASFCVLKVIGKYYPELEKTAKKKIKKVQQRLVRLYPDLVEIKDSQIIINGISYSSEL